MDTLTGSAAAQLLAGKRLCSRCIGTPSAGEPFYDAPTRNALAVDVDDVVHVGDAIEGMTLCGRNGNAWRWVIPTTTPQLEDRREP